MAEDEQTEGDVEIGALTLDIVAAIGPILVNDPLAAAPIAAVTLGTSAALKGVLGRRQRRHLATMEAAVRDLAGSKLPELMRRIEQVEEAASLALLAVQSTGAAEADQQARANGHLLAHGVLDRVEDEAGFLIRTISRFGEIELRGLQALFADRQRQPGAWSSASQVLDGVVPADIIDPLLAALAAAGCIRLDPPDLPSFILTPLGVRVASELVEGSSGRL